MLDLFLWLSGEKARRVFCRASRRLHGLEIEDYDTLIVETDGGALGTFEVGYTCPGSRYVEYVAVCTDRLALATPSYGSGTIVFRDGRELDVAGPGLPPALNYVEETLRRVQGGEPPLASISSSASRATTRAPARCSMSWPWTASNAPRPSPPPPTDRCA